jgi:dinuclear metal center YbgI/SA1388 family protein
MKIKEVLNALERFAPLPLQDGFDNAGLQLGLTDAEVSGALLCLDVTEAVLDEAIRLGYNLVLSHHPLLFHGLKSISGRNYIERCVMKAIKHDIVVYSAHTNLDNAPEGVNWWMCQKLGIEHPQALEPKEGCLLENAGAGMIGELPKAYSQMEFLKLVKETFGVGCVLYNRPSEEKEIRRVALCGGAGAFLAEEARQKGADAFITGEMKYHEFFNYDDLLLAVIGHYESEQYTQELFKNIIEKEFQGLPVQLTSVRTNPIYYL